MAFKTSDFKKVVRGKGEARQLYPHQIRDERYTAAISYAIAYYERMVGRRRAEFEGDTLLEFFGDPRLARGLVACLGRSYSWRTQTFEERFGEHVQLLEASDVTAPQLLRARLYRLANERFNGFVLPGERDTALNSLLDGLGAAATATLTVEQLDSALTLDSEGERVLLKVGETPSPEEIVARYNYHSLETALCYAEAIRLQLQGSVWSMVRSAHNLARRYRLSYRLGDAPQSLFDDRLDLTLRGARDALGNWGRAGRRLTRATLRLLAVHPESALSGEAIVHLNGQRYTLKLDERALRILGAGASETTDAHEPWDWEEVELFRRAWSRAQAAGRVGGWRLRRDPEPLIGPECIVVPDFVIQRGNVSYALCLANGRSMAEALMHDLAQFGARPPAIVVLADAVALQLRSCPVPIASYPQQAADAIPQIINLLEHDRRQARAA
jgi:hypothetical protein